MNKYLHVNHLLLFLTRLKIWKKDPKMYIVWFKSVVKLEHWQIKSFFFKIKKKNTCFFPSYYFSNGFEQNVLFWIAPIYAWHLYGHLGLWERWVIKHIKAPEKSQSWAYWFVKKRTCDDVEFFITNWNNNNFEKNVLFTRFEICL